MSAALGVLAAALGVLVISGELGAFDTEGAWWIAIAALIVGLAIIPWRRNPGLAAPAEVIVDEPEPQPED